MCGSCSYVSALGNQEVVRMYCQSIRDYLNGSRPRMPCSEAVSWNSCSRFKHCAMHSAIRSPEFDPIGTIGLQAVGDDLV